MQIKDLLPWARKEGSGELKGAEDNPIAALQREMNRAFESFWSRGERPFGGLAAVFGEGAPRSDVVETEAGIEVTVELPGLEEKDIEVSLSDEALTIKGEKKVERKDEKKGYYISERSYGSVYRSIPLPAGVDSDKAEASFKNGVLTVKLLQRPEAKANVKKIEVKTA
jgi:HSP20 family protein